MYQDEEPDLVELLGRSVITKLLAKTDSKLITERRNNTRSLAEN
jgi:hypothetical protein